MRLPQRLLALCSATVLAVGVSACTGGSRGSVGGGGRTDDVARAVPRECVSPSKATRAEIGTPRTPRARSAAAGDTNGDGVQDLVVDGWYRPVDGGGWRRNLAALHGTRSGQVKPSEGISLTGEGHEVKQERPGNPRTGAGGVLPAADIDGDTYADAVVQGTEKGGRGERSVQYLARGSERGIRKLTVLSRSLPVFDMSGSTDLLGDGIIDVLAFRPPGNQWDQSGDARCDTLFVLRGPFNRDGDPDRVTAVDMSLGGTVTTRQVVWGDFTGDGLTDLLAESVVGDPDPSDEADEPPTSDHVELYVGTAHGFASAGPPPGIKPWGDPLLDRPLSVGDFDGDGADDVLQGAAVRFGGEGFPAGGGRTGRAPVVRAAAVGDVNGDGRDDLVGARYGRRHPVGTVAVHLGGGPGLRHEAQSTFDRHVLELPGRPGHEADSDFFGWDVVTADLNADGRDELIVGHLGFHRPREENGYWVFPGTPEGSSADGAYFLATHELGAG
ncbi:FG-GAP repeat domain-containing protein [Streptomyces sp. NPDC087844]|uniref:FG-GAP repeat domain-containing protein n=1 Tax=Streptomyces sp. NPDC087844 TaxID=3365805 RepID=UPI0038160533